VTERLNAQQAATRAGVARGTWTAYVSRGYAPRHDGRDEGTGRPYWLASTIDAWKPTRAGQGAGGGGRPRKEQPARTNARKTGDSTESDFPRV